MERDAYRLCRAILHGRLLHETKVQPRKPSALDSQFSVRALPLSPWLVLLVLDPSKNWTGLRLMVYAHALDFSLVSVMPTREQAIEKLRLTIKTYIEYGLSESLDEDIMFPAPAEFWDRLSTEAPIVMLDPIMVRDKSTTKRVTVFEAMLADEALRPALRT